jgi:hypothetical protein
MRRWFVSLFAVMATVGALLAPPAVAGDAPVGRLGDTLRVQDTDVIADVTVSNVLPVDLPPGITYWRGTSDAIAFPLVPKYYRAQVSVHAVKVPNPYIMAVAFTFKGLTPNADAYNSQHTDSPDGLEYAVENAPQGSTVTGGVYWDCYRNQVSNVVLLNPQTGVHLAQWNL